MPRGVLAFPMALKERNEARERESLTNPGHLRTRGLAQRARESAQSPKKKKKKKKKKKEEEEGEHVKPSRHCAPPHGLNQYGAPI